MCMSMKKTLREIKDPKEHTPCLGTERSTPNKSQFSRVGLEILYNPSQNLNFSSRVEGYRI